MIYTTENDFGKCKVVEVSTDLASPKTIFRCVYKNRINYLSNMQKSIIIFILITFAPFLLSAQLKEWAIEPQFDEIIRGGRHIVFLKQANKWGIFDDTGEMIAAPQYDSLSFMSESYVLVYQNNRKGLFSYVSKRLCITPEYEVINHPATLSKRASLFAVQKNGLWGLVDTNNQIIVSCTYPRPIWTTNDTWLTSKDEHYSATEIVYKETRINTVDHRYLPKSYVFKNLPSPLPQGLNPEPEHPNPMYQFDVVYAQARKSKDDSNDNFKEFFEDSSVPKKKKFFLTIDEHHNAQLSKGDFKTLFEYSFSGFYSFGSRFLMLQKEKDGNWGLWDMHTEKFKTDYIYQQIMFNSPTQLYIYTRNNKTGFMNADGEEVIPPIYDKAERVESWIVVHKNGKVGLMNRKNEFFLPIEYNQLFFIESCRGVWIKQNGKWGLMQFYW